MSSEKPLVNRVAQSSLITLKLDDMLPAPELAAFDIKDYLFRELILKEKDFRAALAEHDWEQYRGKTLLVFCSNDAIVPIWAYMLVAANATPYADAVFQGTEAEFFRHAFRELIDGIDPETYRDARLVIKGCSDREVPLSAYLDLTARLQPVARSIMFGEPCSTVPIFKRK